MGGDLTDDVVLRVAGRFPLTQARIVERLQASVRNDNFVLEDAASRRYVLRRYRRNPDERRMRFQVEFQQQLYRLGYPTSEIVPSNAGDLLVEAEGSSWVVFTFVEGDEYDFARMGQVAEAGRRLAQFHTVTATIELEEIVLDINPQLRRWWTHGEEELAALEALFRAEAVEEELTFLRGWHADLVRRWPLARLDALPVGWVHSDFHGRNMVFAGDELRGLFDFDPLHRGFFAEDIAHALFMFGREFRGSTRIRPEAARLFLGAYDGVRPIGDEERAAIPMMAVLAWAHSAPYHALLARDGEDTLAFFRHWVQLMRDLEAEMARLMPVLAP
jgi:homoserine kinase type II